MIPSAPLSPAGMPFQAASQWDEAGWLSWAERIESPNFSQRPANTDISLVVMHAISLPPEQFGGDCVERFFTNCLPADEHPYFAEIAGVQVSAHFYLRRTGKLVQFVSADARAWHAGASTWQGRSNCNDYSIGIELEGSDNQPFTIEQYQALLPLIAALGQRYPINAIAGHSDIAPGRKTDPGPYFDWRIVQMAYPEMVYATQY